MKEKGQTMNDKLDKSTGGLGLLANGSSALWDVSVDEALDQEQWFLELDGPETYLVFQLQDLKVIPAALRFLQSSLRPNSIGAAQRNHKDEVALALGRFGPAAVSLLKDNEDVPRCFLVVGSKGRSVMRLSLAERDIKMLIEALSQVVEALPVGSDE
jgi:hypothetical protein